MSEFKSGKTWKLLIKLCRSSSSECNTIFFISHSLSFIGLFLKQFLLLSQELVKWWHVSLLLSLLVINNSALGVFNLKCIQVVSINCALAVALLQHHTIVIDLLLVLGATLLKNLINILVSLVVNVIIVLTLKFFLGKFIWAACFFVNKSHMGLLIEIFFLVRSFFVNLITFSHNIIIIAQWSIIWIETIIKLMGGCLVVLSFFFDNFWETSIFHDLSLWLDLFVIEYFFDSFSKLNYFSSFLNLVESNTHHSLHAANIVIMNQGVFVEAKQC